MKLYAVTSYDGVNGDYYVDFYMADDHAHAEDQAKDENPPDHNIVISVRVPFYIIERAYIIESKKQQI